jgi:Fur family ferric uptake transcriptional regulator
MDRRTRQREAIRRVFMETGRPLGASEILRAARAHAPGLGIATVYRTVKGLVQEGWLVPVALLGEPPRYETAGKKHHHHFRCRRCDRVYEIKGCLTDLRRLLPRGFRLEAHEVLLTGLCTACA